MDYANRRRLKIFGRMKVIHAADDFAPAADLAISGYPGHVERAVTIAMEAFDWNRPQHITRRFTEDEFAAALQAEARKPCFAPIEGWRGPGRRPSTPGHKFPIMFGRNAQKQLRAATGELSRKPGEFQGPAVADRR